MRGYGALTAMVGATLGIPINYYVRVDMGGFRDVIDALGGAVVDVQLPVYDSRYATDDGRGAIKLYIPPGVVEIKEAASEAHLKVILETGELETYDNVRRASILAMAAGTDFIKTSTGKVTPAATMPVTLVMLEAIRDFERATGRQVGMKPAGGIKTAKEAIQYLVILYETLGPRWMSPIGSGSARRSLLNDVLMQIEFQRRAATRTPTTSRSTDGGASPRWPWSWRRRRSWDALGPRRRRSTRRTSRCTRVGPMPARRPSLSRRMAGPYRSQPTCGGSTGAE